MSDRPDPSDESDVVVEPGKRPCPICGNHMIVERNGKVRMDVCEDHGVWLDTGELESIVRRVRSKGRASADNKVSRARHQGKVSGMLWGPLSFLFD